MFKLRELLERIHRDRVLIALEGIVQRERIKLYLVGGTIRDLALGSNRRDYDFVLRRRDLGFVTRLALELKGHAFSIGRNEKQRVCRILLGDDILDFTALDGPTIGEDLGKRDFTINAMAYSLHEHRFYSHPRSKADINERLIRMVSPEGFDRDPLRMIRGLRYLCTLEGFRLDGETKAAIRRKANLVRNIPVERIKMELDRILLSPKPFIAMEELVVLGLFSEIFPELGINRDLGGEALFRTDAFYHYLQFLRCLAHWRKSHGDFPLSVEEKLILSYVALFTSMGRLLGPRDHREGSLSQLTYEIMTRMKFSNRFKELAQKLMNHHEELLKLSRAKVDQKALKQFIYRVGSPIRLLTAFSLLEKRAMPSGELSRKDQEVVRLCHRMRDLCKEGNIISPPPLVTGRDIVRLGYEPGPIVGYILRCVREKQVRGEIGDRAQALDFLRETFGSDRTSHPSP
jgi:tRNA nucleotidyltransferase/poly(A) polymerase